jgi:catechol 2,3-dioxygenase-like lactoylglutathione lyase family enzyme
MPILTLDHVQLAMPAGREDDARSFYVGLLGMTEKAKPEPFAARGGVWFSSGSARLHLGIEAPFAAARKAHPAFLVTEIDGLAMTLRAAKARVEWDAMIPGLRRFYSDDPFGNRIEFVATN